MRAISSPFEVVRYAVTNSGTRKTIANNEATRKLAIKIGLIRLLNRRTVGKVIVIIVVTILAIDEPTYWAKTIPFPEQFQFHVGSGVIINVHKLVRAERS